MSGAGLAVGYTRNRFLSLPGRERSRRALKDQSPIDPLRSGVVLETQLGRDLPSVRGDRVQLQQVIMNLVMNAVEAMGGMDEGTRELQIATDKDRDEHVAITVSRSGLMLEPQSLNRFFA